MVANKHGLSRHIPDPVKFAVRRDCGFGCVFCGSTVIEYEHFSPDFVDATEHDPDGIALVCPTHHALITKKQIPKNQVKEARANPRTKQVGFASELHPYFRGIPELKLGRGVHLIDVPIPVMVSGRPIISFNSHLDADEISTVSMALSDQVGNSILQVHENEWRVDTGVWDFQSISNRYIIRSRDKSCYIALRFEPPNLISIDNAYFYVGGIPLLMNEEGIFFRNTHIRDGVFENCHIGFGFD